MRNINNKSKGEKVKGKDKVVNYPQSIERIFDDMDTVCEIGDGVMHHALKTILINAKLPKLTRFLWTGAEYEAAITSFDILLPNGMIFRGVAIFKDGDEPDDFKPVLIAAGRALACVRHYQDRSGAEKDFIRHLGGIVNGVRVRP